MYEIGQEFPSHLLNRVSEVIRTLKGLQTIGLNGCQWTHNDKFVAKNRR
jgi:hypothetical protein